MLPANLSADGNNTVGDMITYSCDEGYYVDGPLSSICQINGSWTNDPPICQGISFISLENYFFVL